MGLKVSVVVAGYNAGEYAVPMIRSLVRQSMSSAEYEVILVNDGSTDGTAEKFDEAASRHTHVRVINLSNSGWPGRPRNVGLAAALGEYVYFVDADDFLAPEALERMYALGSQHRADIIIGKIVGHGRGAPSTLFSFTRPHASLATAPLTESMTCHKMFRRAFLESHDLRFPEGRRRLEDHVFVVQAYLLAHGVSVLSDYSCYHLTKRDDGGNISHLPFAPADYFNNLREAIDAAENLSAPGDVQDKILRRWYATEMLKRVGGAAFVSLPEDYRLSLYREVRKLALSRFTRPSIWQPLSPRLRARSDLLREGRLDDLVRLAVFESQLRLVPSLELVGWERGVLHLDLSLTIEGPDQRDVQIHWSAASAKWMLRVGDASGALDSIEVAPHDARAVLILRNRETLVEHEMPMVQDGEKTPAAGPFEVKSIARVAPDEVAAKLGEGVWDIFCRLSGWGWPPLSRRVGSVRGDAVKKYLPPALIGDPPLLLMPYWTNQGNLSIDLGQNVHNLAQVLRGHCSGAEVKRTLAGPTVRVAVPIHVAPGAGDLPIVVRLDRGGVDDLVADGKIGPAANDSDTAVVEARLPHYRTGGELALRTREQARQRQDLLGVTLPDAGWAPPFR